MTKYITIKLTEDQANHLVSLLHVELLKVEEIPDLQESPKVHAFIARLIGKINAELATLAK